MDIKAFRAKLNEVYRLVSLLAVRGDAVDIVAEARLILRELRNEVTNLESAVPVSHGIPTTAVAEPAKTQALESDPGHPVGSPGHECATAPVPNASLAPDGQLDEKEVNANGGQDNG